MGTARSPTPSSIARSSSATSQHSTIVAGAPGVEVEDDRGRAIRLGRERQRRVQLERRELREPDERRPVLARGGARCARGRRRRSRCATQSGRCAGRALLEEPLAVHAVGTAHERQRAAAQVRAAATGAIAAAYSSTCRFVVPSGNSTLSRFVTGISRSSTIAVATAALPADGRARPRSDERRRHVVAQPEPDGLAQLPVRRPLAERDLGDEDRPHPARRRAAAAGAPARTALASIASSPSAATEVARAPPRERPEPTRPT